MKRFLRTSYDDVKGRTSVNVDGNSGEEKKMMSNETEKQKLKSYFLAVNETPKAIY